jgi:hypothetical protein
MHARRAGVGAANTALLALLVACAQQPAAPAPSEFRLAYLAKTDIDMVADLHCQAAFADLQALALKLYRRNPREWRPSGAPSPETRTQRIFRRPYRWDHPELGGRRGADAVLLAFDEGYRGDRVLAFVVGLASMLEVAYNGKSEFFVFDGLDAQRLYNSARNLEIAAWKLGHARRPDGQPYLVSNALDGPVTNLSYERLFGKLIAEQDMLARIVAEKRNRAIKSVLQNLATAAFLPM